MPEPRYWRVTLKRGHKAHLMPFVEGQSAGELALCQKELPADLWRGPARTVISPKGDECQACRIIAGVVAKSKRVLTPEERQELGRVNAFAKLPGMLAALGLSVSEITAFLETVSKVQSDT